ncbi:hypothetical protein BJF79_42835 [Actinomadura sp. CNU-125]|nr:hypothetical protein BJF79_42835 [Actinomadura sp. CNU-125]
MDLLHGAADLAVFGATGRMLAEAERTGAGLARLPRAATSGRPPPGAVGVLVQGVTTAAVTAVAIGAGAVRACSSRCSRWWR